MFNYSLICCSSCVNRIPQFTKNIFILTNLTPLVKFKYVDWIVAKALAECLNLGSPNFFVFLWYVITFVHMTNNSTVYSIWGAMNWHKDILIIFYHEIKLNVRTSFRTCLICGKSCLMRVTLFFFDSASDTLLLFPENIAVK